MARTLRLKPLADASGYYESDSLHGSADQQLKR